MNNMNNNLTDNMAKRQQGTNKLMTFFNEQNRQQERERAITNDMMLAMFDEPLKFVHAIAKNMSVAVETNATMAQTINYTQDEYEARANANELLKQLTLYKNEAQQDYARNSQTGMFNVPARREQAERALTKYKEFDSAIVELKQAIKGEHRLNRKRVAYEFGSPAGTVTPTQRPY